MTTKVSDVLKWIWHSSKRIVVFVIGVALLAGGLAMLVLPGPGLLVIIAGLAVLATEFVWAEVALDKAKTRAAQAGTMAKKGLGSLNRRRRRTAADQ